MVIEESICFVLDLLVCLQDAQYAAGCYLVVLKISWRRGWIALGRVHGSVDGKQEAVDAIPQLCRKIEKAEACLLLLLRSMKMSAVSFDDCLHELLRTSSVCLSFHSCEHW